MGSQIPVVLAKSKLEKPLGADCINTVTSHAPTVIADQNRKLIVWPKPVEGGAH